MDEAWDIIITANKGDGMSISSWMRFVSNFYENYDDDGDNNNG